MSFPMLTGRKFERLLVIQYLYRNKNGKRFWLCICDCGKLHPADAGNLKQNKVKSCGCLNKESIDAKRFNFALKGSIPHENHKKFGYNTR